jgi:hypothetical protein
MPHFWKHQVNTGTSQTSDGVVLKVIVVFSVVEWFS